MTTYVARLTPAGTSAIATIGLWGPEAVAIWSKHWKPRRGGPRSVCDGGSKPFLVGQVGDDASRDDVVVAIDQDQVLIHCHGGEALVAWLIDLFRQAGAREAKWQDWVRARHPSPVEADAAIALAAARTLRCANVLLDQQEGALRRWLEAWLARPDAEELARLLNWLPLGLHLTEPWRVVIAGSTNVGKSTLCNALLGYQRAITSPMPGTTRDVLTALTAIDGWPVELVDAAGLREEAQGLEAEGVARARGQIRQADLVLWVVDPVQPPAWPSAELAPRCVLVLNKSDLATEPLAPWPGEPFQAPIRVSAMIGSGIPELLGRVARQLVPETPPPGAAVPFTAAQGQALQAALAACRAGDLAQARAAACALLEASESAASPA